MTPQPTADEIVYPTDLPETDGEPLESDWHRLAMNLLIEVVRYHFRDRRDYFAGGNMFIYFSLEQVRNRDYRGPDFFFVWGVERDKRRDYYAVWNENHRYPNVILELLSPTTAKEDRTTKKTLYERTFRTPEYFLYDRETKLLEGYRLSDSNGYEPIEREPNGRLWSKQLELYLGLWDGPFLQWTDTYVRAFDVHGRLVPLWGEAAERHAEEVKRLADDEKQRADDEKQRADDEKQRADDEKQRADDAVAELTRLREQLAKLQSQQPPTN